MKISLSARPLVLLFTSACLCAASSGEFSEESGETLLLQSPSVGEQHVVFVFANDLWVVPRVGGDARRLTSHVGGEAAPKISPDGTQVAFSGQYEGNLDVYVIPLEGGTPRRLTWHPGSDVMVDWMPDGKSLIFRSTRNSNPRMPKLYQIAVEGQGLPSQLDVPKVNHASIAPDGKRVAYTPFRDAFQTWKRYRGGTIPPVWILDLDSHDVTEVPHVRASDTFPDWLGEDLYFASDRDGCMNLYRYRPGSDDVEQITNFDDFHIRSLDAGGGVVVFEQAGALHIYDPKTENVERLRITARADGLAALPRWQSVGRAVRNAAISPNGKRAVFEARGEIITVPKENGDPRNLTNSPGVHERDPSWSPDGKEIAWFSDEGGEYHLVVSDRLGREETRKFDLGNGGFYRSPAWSPDGKHVLFNDKTNRIAFVTLETGDVTEVAQLNGSLGEIGPASVWSPNSKWIAFTNRNERTLYDHIAMYELETGKIISITDDFGAAGNPAFSKDGKLLFFDASVDMGPNMFGLDMSTSASREPNNRLYVAVLDRKAENPLKPKSDEGVKTSSDKKKKGDRKDDGTEDSDDPDGEDDSTEEEDDPDDDETEEEDSEDPDEEGGDEESGEDEDSEEALDLEGVDQRILALPVGSGLYRGLATAGDKLLFVDTSDTPALKSFDFDSRKEKTLASGVRNFEVSADGKSLLTSSGGSYSIRNASGKDAKSLNIGSVQVRVDPNEEWPQILREVWRIQRDYFYDENMHGVDWEEMWQRWEPFLTHARHRDDLNVIVQEMIGELACGHQYTGGGDMPDAPRAISVGLLGADWEVDSNRYRVTKIYRGQNWNASQRAPLTEPGVDIQEGDYLIEVNGRAIMADENLFKSFENTAGRQVEISVAATPDGADARNSTVVPLSSESSLRQMSWIEENRRRVDRLSDGRLAYIYMPNTAGAGRAAFDRDFYSQLDREGVIVDERYNGGGQVANYVIDILSRDVMSYWMNREKWVGQSPFGTIDGPKVMIINESAGSGGDWMPWTFKNREIGPLVGTRTWGGLVGISGYPPLMDGGFVTAASFGVMDEDGNWAVENVGVAPDFEVVEWPDQVLAGKDPQLDRAVEIALEALKTYEKRPRPTYTPPAAR